MKSATRLLRICLLYTSIYVDDVYTLTVDDTFWFSEKWHKVNEINDEDEFDKWLKKIRDALNSPTEKCAVATGRAADLSTRAGWTVCLHGVLGTFPPKQMNCAEL